MRRWLNASVPAAADVADRSSLWLPGSLAFMVTVGWLALLLGVARPPTIAELTFLGAGIVTSGQWPWNGIVILAAAMVLTATAIALASVAEAALLHGRRARPADVRRTFLVGVVCVVPLAAPVAALLVALSFVAPGEFNAPEPGRRAAAADPHRARTAHRGRRSWPRCSVAPSMPPPPGRPATVTVRGAHCEPRPRRSAAPGRRRSARCWRCSRRASAIWRSARSCCGCCGRRSTSGCPAEGFGLAVIGLLVGFVAIWLCLVLAGGALHAWGSVSWTRLLDTRGSEAGAVAQMESRSRP